MRRLQIHGDLIVRRRAVLGLSQFELSARAAVDIKTLQGLEAGTTQSPRAVTIGKIANVIGVDVAELLVGLGLADAAKSKSPRERIADGQGTSDREQVTLAHRDDGTYSPVEIAIRRALRQPSKM